VLNDDAQHILGLYDWFIMEEPARRSVENFKELV
jgi:hypothetical protein